VRLVRALVAIIAVMAIVSVFADDPEGPHARPVDGAPSLSVDLSDMLPAVPFELPLLPPNESAPLLVDNRPPPSRLATADVFRPPSVRG
jgi:hypothetical protein